jgi:hypothetical protein
VIFAFEKRTQGAILKFLCVNQCSCTAQVLKVFFAGMMGLLTIFVGPG